MGHMSTSRRFLTGAGNRGEVDNSQPEGDTGTFTIIFVPGGYGTGPGDNNRPWRTVGATADLTGLQGDGDWWTVYEA